MKLTFLSMVARDGCLAQIWAFEKLPLETKANMDFISSPPSHSNVPTENTYDVMQLFHIYHSC